MAENGLQTWRPMVAGILNIIVGASGLGLVIFMIIAITITGGAFDIPGIGAVPDFVPWLLTLIAFIAAAFNGLILAGGICALQRKCWGLALAGSIASFIMSTVMGVLSVIFVAMAKEEFES